MKLGMFSVEIARPSVEEFFQALSDYGISEVQFDFLTVCSEEMPLAIDRSLTERIRAAAKASDVGIVAVNGTFNMSHPDPATREEGVRRFESVARATAELGCRFVTLCTGSRDTQNMWRRHEDNDTPEAWRDLMDTTRKALDIADHYDLMLGVETEQSNVVRTALRARRYLDEVGSDRIKIIMDVANLFLPGQAKKELVRGVMDEAFDLLGKDIHLAHGKDLKEGEGLSFTHAGNGIVDFPYFLQKLKACGYRGNMLLHGIKKEEYFPESLRFVRGMIDRYWN